MVTELTIGNLVDIVLQDGSDFPPLPDVVRLSGLYPFDAAATDGCGMQQDSNTSDVAQLNMKCFAYIYFNPSSAKREIAFQSGSGSIEIEKGVGFQGKLNFLGWQIKLKVAVSSSQFLVDGEMDLVDLKIGDEPFLRIGKELDTTNKAVGGAKFLIDLKGLPNPSALIEIAGAFDIPLLDSYGYVAITLTNEIFSFSAGITLFGGVLSTHAMVEWDWALTYFKMSLDDIQFIGGVVTLKKLVFQYDKNLAFARFDAAISVLWFLSFELFVDVKGDRIGFGFTLDVLGAATTIDGTAVVANPFANSEFDVMVTCSFNPDTLEEIGEDINQIVQDVAQFAEKAWANVSAKVEELWNDIKEIFSNGLSAIGGAITGLLEDVQAFLKDAAAALKDVPVLGKLLELGSLLAEGDVDGFLKGLGSALGLFDSIDFRELGGPARGRSKCSQEFDITYEDSVPDKDPSVCNRWTIRRTWQVLPFFADANCVPSGKKSAEAVQVITIDDNTAPKWTLSPEPEAVVPFFNNFQEQVTIPSAHETATDVMLNLGLTLYPTQLTSEDGPLTLFPTTSGESLCRVNGLAQFTRTWRAQDKCGNTRTAVQIITVMHPPTTLAETKTLRPLPAQDFSYAPGITQLADRCNAGKKVELGIKHYNPLDNTDDTDACGVGVWSPVGCRRLNAAVREVSVVHSVPPVFATFPDDITINTTHSLNPKSGLGEPVGGAYCGTPFHIWFADAPPVLQKCGEWTIERTWKIQPHYKDCGLGDVYPNSLTTVRVQVITVRDISPPAWLFKPQAP
ncbi:hypothetical protein DIPPA_22347 [Diplonema papillatum]|nr:hypothetical protein DIPPA_22347 [Diplonema papillatum]